MFWYWCMYARDTYRKNNFIFGDQERYKTWCCYIDMFLSWCSNQRTCADNLVEYMLDVVILISVLYYLLILNNIAFCVVNNLPGSVWKTRILDHDCCGISMHRCMGDCWISTITCVTCISTNPKWLSRVSVVTRVTIISRDCRYTWQPFRMTTVLSDNVV